MSILELVFLAVGLSMDAFAVSVCKGLSTGRVKPVNAVAAGGYFGIFQALMPTIGFFVGTSFSSLIESFDHWIVFALLLAIGANMIREAFSENEQVDSSYSFKSMIVLAVATSIDALAVGVSFAALAMKPLQLTVSVLIIGAITFIISGLGVYIGSIFGERYKRPAQITGGVILVIIGIKILVEHLISNS